MEYTIQGTEAQKFLNKFPKFPKEFYKERQAMETVDLKLDNLESFEYISPKKIPTHTIHWNEKRDIQLYWKSQEQIINLFMAFAFFVLAYYLIVIGF